VHMSKSRLFRKPVQHYLWSFEEPDDSAISAALRLYRKARFLGWLGMVWSSITRNDRKLVDLNTIKTRKPIYGWSYTGIQDVPIDKVIGSEGYCDDFDKSFYPLRAHTKVRWLNVAISRQMGFHPQPVELIQITSKFFVQSGHYHISVTRVMGQKTIRAYVTRWHIFNEPNQFNMSSHFHESSPISLTNSSMNENK
jgi:hypothetical protein